MYITHTHAHTYTWYMSKTLKAKQKTHQNPQTKTKQKKIPENSNKPPHHCPCHSECNEVAEQALLLITKRLLVPSISHSAHWSGSRHHPTWKGCDHSPQAAPQLKSKAVCTSQPQPQSQQSFVLPEIPSYNSKHQPRQGLVANGAKTREVKLTNETGGGETSF